MKFVMDVMPQVTTPNLYSFSSNIRKYEREVASSREVKLCVIAHDRLRIRITDTTSPDVTLPNLTQSNLISPFHK
jgi:hypothetical protein